MDMKEQDVLRIVRTILSSVVDLVDSSNENKIHPVLLNVRNGAVGFISLLDEVILDEVIEAERLEDSPQNDQQQSETKRTPSP